ncbi:dihydropteroate synthase [Microcella humidisoli]|uniref:7,8-dihydroneopterin aldolase n=1 Tax=Microcella humidisoli TaxID=2963406 RepID=A0ABY5FZM3_9MICO|nr:dihydropteroate synthase [Microcella humidisoli]UTT63305.1 dihydropteroate synthase [Microcella humidisoli]
MTGLNPRPELRAAGAAARPQLWGVLNVTPDSFSDGGRFVDPEAALAQGRRLIAEGASVIDVGGESTRPGAEPVAPEVERERVLPVVAALAAEGIRVSIDTMNASTAAAAVEAGAAIVNDVSGGLADPAMLDTVAQLGTPYVLMHWRGPSETWHTVSDYTWAPQDVTNELLGRWHAALEAGVQPERLWVDPGLGFAKRAEHNWQLLAELGTLRSIGARVLLGASRKRFLGALLPDDAAVEERDLLTAVISALAAGHVDALRVHDVRSSARALDVWQSIAAGAAQTPVFGGSYTASPPAEAATRGDRPASDRITLTGLRAFAHHGVFDHERRDGQEFVIDVTAHLDLRGAAAYDELASTVHYGELAEQVVAAVETDPVDLIETVAERVAGVVLRHGAVWQTEVTVHKPQAPITVPFADVSVSIVRGRS